MKEKRIIIPMMMTCKRNRENREWEYTRERMYLRERDQSIESYLRQTLNWSWIHEHLQFSSSIFFCTHLNSLKNSNIRCYLSFLWDNPKPYLEWSELCWSCLYRITIIWPFSLCPRVLPGLHIYSLLSQSGQHYFILILILKLIVSIMYHILCTRYFSKSLANLTINISPILQARKLRPRCWVTLPMVIYLKFEPMQFDSRIHAVNHFVLFCFVTWDSNTVGNILTLCFAYWFTPMSKMDRSIVSSFRNISPRE